MSTERMSDERMREFPALVQPDKIRYFSVHSYPKATTLTFEKRGLPKAKIQCPR